MTALNLGISLIGGMYARPAVAAAKKANAASEYKKAQDMLAECEEDITWRFCNIIYNKESMISNLRNLLKKAKDTGNYSEFYGVLAEYNERILPYKRKAEKINAILTPAYELLENHKDKFNPPHYDMYVDHYNKFYNDALCSDYSWQKELKENNDYMVLDFKKHIKNYQFEKYRAERCWKKSTQDGGYKEVASASTWDNEKVPGATIIRFDIDIYDPFGNSKKSYYEFHKIIYDEKQMKWKRIDVRIEKR